MYWLMLSTFFFFVLFLQKPWLVYPLLDFLTVISFKTDLVALDSSCVEMDGV